MYKIANKLRQIQNVLVKDDHGRSATLTLMPKGKHGSEKIIQESQMTDDVSSKQARGYLAVIEVRE